MKTPIDSSAAGAGATVALLETSGIAGAGPQLIDLYKLTLNGGGVVYWHGGPMNSSVSFTAAGGQPTTANGTYLAGPVIDHGKISTQLGTQTATLDLKIGATLSDLINGTPLTPFVMNRGLDGASLVLYRGIFPAWPTNPNTPLALTGVVIAFSGRVTEIKDIGRTKFTVTVSSWFKLLDVNMGPDVFQAGCLNTHYDVNCGLTIITSGAGQNSFNGAVGAGTPTINAFLSNLTNADHYFDKGRFTFTSGANAGVARAVQTYLNASGSLVFSYAFPAAPAPGDTFTAIRGCLLTLPDCKAQRTTLDAEQHFRGQPFTPAAIQGVV